MGRQVTITRNCVGEPHLASSHDGHSKEDEVKVVARVEAMPHSRQSEASESRIDEGGPLVHTSNTHTHTHTFTTQ